MFVEILGCLLGFGMFVGILGCLLGFGGFLGCRDESEVSEKIPKKIPEGLSRAQDGGGERIPDQILLPLRNPQKSLEWQGNDPGNGIPESPKPQIPESPNS